MSQDLVERNSVVRSHVQCAVACMLTIHIDSIRLGTYRLEYTVTTPLQKFSTDEIEETGFRNVEGCREGLSAELPGLSIRLVVDVQRIQAESGRIARFYEVFHAVP